MNADEKIALKTFGSRLRVWRNSKHLTKEALAHQAGITRLYLSELELGKKNPSLVVMLKLAKALGLKGVSELLGGPAIWRRR